MFLPDGDDKFSKVNYVNPKKRKTMDFNKLKYITTTNIYKTNKKWKINTIIVDELNLL